MSSNAKSVYDEFALEVNKLSVAFNMYDKGLNKNALEVIHELNINVKKGEIVVVVGSSGSGKSLLAHAIFGILPDNANLNGKIKFKGNRYYKAVSKKTKIAVK